MKKNETMNILTSRTNWICH